MHASGNIAIKNAFIKRIYQLCMQSTLRPHTHIITEYHSAAFKWIKILFSLSGTVCISGSYHRAHQCEWRSSPTEALQTFDAFCGLLPGLSVTSFVPKTGGGRWSHGRMIWTSKEALKWGRDNSCALLKTDCSWSWIRLSSHRFRMSTSVCCQPRASVQKIAFLILESASVNVTCGLYEPKVRVLKERC